MASGMTWDKNHFIFGGDSKTLWIISSNQFVLCTLSVVSEDYFSLTASSEF